MRVAIWGLAAWLGAATVAMPASAQNAGALTPSPANAKVYFVDLKDGATIGPTTTIHFGLEGMGVAPAGVAKANTGHFHLLIDTELASKDEPIPNNENNLHYGAGQTQATVTLAPGKHTLQIVLGDANHVPHNPPVMSPVIHVTVAEQAPAAAPAASSAAPGLTPSPPNAKAYFVDLKDGATIGPTTTIHFGLEGMGVAPAGMVKPNTGHFHLLIDTELASKDEPIPNNENNLHYGAGQTQASVTLAPGKHTLQIVMGDANHIPHNPPVMSPVLHVTVAEQAPAASPAPAAAPATKGGRHPSPANAKVYIASPANWSYVPGTFTVRFGLTGMGVAPAGFEKPNSGHHHLIIDAPLPPINEPIPNNENYLHFGAGQTEATVTLPTGKHTLQLLLGDANHVPHDPPVYSQQITVLVGMTPPKPNRPARRHYHRHNHG